jgi:predicted glycosyltransferase
MARRVLFHVQHLLGIGHLQRSLRIANALVARGIDVTLLHGGLPVPEIDRASAIEIVQLPPIRARDATFALVDEAGNPLDDALRAARRDKLLAAFATAKPDVVVIEGFPFARRGFRFELDPLIAALRKTQPRPLLLCSVRDIPTVRGNPERLRDIVDRVRSDFDAVLVHGDPNFIPFDAAFPATPELADRIHYTGYVTTSVVSERNVLSGEVLVSVGGGAAGRALLTAAIEARRRGCLAHYPWRILAGTGLSDAEFATLRGEAPAGVAVERFRRDFAALLRRCHVSVSQAGYNTVVDILAARVRAVLVPFAAERETEQSIRAEHVAARGGALLVRESELSWQSLAVAIERAAVSEPRPIALDTDGAAHSATLIGEFIAKRATAEASLRDRPAV